AVVGVLASPSAHADSHFQFYFGTAPVVVAPPVYVRPTPVVVAPPVIYDYDYWQPGYYAWVGYERRWVPGRYVRRGPGAGWHRGWDRGWDRGDRWERGRWDRERGRDRYDRDYRGSVRGDWRR